MFFFFLTNHYFEFIYKQWFPYLFLFLAALVLGCSVWAFSSCGARASLVVDHGPQGCGLRSCGPRLGCPVGCRVFSDWVSNPCPGRRILNHWESLYCVLLLFNPNLFRVVLCPFTSFRKSAVKN